MRRRKGKVLFCTREEVALILAACQVKAPRFLTLFIFLFESGVRKSEAVNLPWKNVLFDQKIIRVWSETDEDDNGDEYVVKSVEREIPMSDHLARRLAELKLKGLSKDWVFPVVTARMKSRGAKYAEFPSNTWDRVLAYATELRRAPAVEAAMKNGASEEEAGRIAKERIPAIKGGPHRARHTFASHFLAAKPDLFLLGRLLGHGHARVTELYAHLIPEHLAEGRNVVTFANEAALGNGSATEKPSLDRPQRARG